MEEPKQIGKVFTYFVNVGVAGIELSSGLKIGDKILVKGSTTNFEQKVDSMQIEGKEVEKAGKGQKVGIKLVERARPNDLIYLIG